MVSHQPYVQRAVLCPKLWALCSPSYYSGVSENMAVMWPKILSIVSRIMWVMSLKLLQWYILMIGSHVLRDTAVMDSKIWESCALRWPWHTLRHRSHVLVDMTAMYPTWNHVTEWKESCGQDTGELHGHTQWTVRVRSASGWVESIRWATH